MSNPGENVWKVTNPRLRVVKRNPLRAGPEEPIVIRSQNRDPNGPQQATKLGNTYVTYHYRILVRTMLS